MLEVFTKFNHIPNVTPATNQGAADALNRAVMACIGAADPLTRVDTGALKGNKTIHNANAGNLNSAVTWNQEYAVYQNMGTVFMSGTHFADHGAEFAKPPLVADMKAIGMTLR